MRLLKVINIYLFLLIYFFTIKINAMNNSNISPHDSDSITNHLKFYPLSIGNKWIYKDHGSSDMWDHYSFYWTKEVIGDTLMPNAQSYFIIIYKYMLDSGYDEDFVYERIDSIAAKVYGYDDSYQTDHLLEDLAASVGDTIPANHYCYSPACETVYLREDSLEIFNKMRVRRNYQSYDLSEHNYYLVEDIGLYSHEYTFDFGWGGSELKGYIVNDTLVGDTTTVGIYKSDLKIKDFYISQNFPNPFNGTTQFQFNIPRKQKVVLNIYDILGQKICTLIDGIHDIGLHFVVWDGKDSLGRQVASGLYIYEIITENNFQRLRMLYLK